MSAHVLNAISLYPPGFGYAMIVSPLFTNVVLTKVRVFSFLVDDRQISGIPPLEYMMDKKLRDRKDYQEYKKNTPVFVPKLF